MSLSTLAISRNLEAKGFTKAQAEGIAETVVEAVESDSYNTVTKDYLQVKTSEIEVKIAEVRGEIKDLKTELKGDIAALDTKTAILDTKFETKIAGLETRMIKWMVGLHLGGLVFLTGLIFFLHSRT